ncbi:MAG: hypothetical protein ACR2H1_02835 [Limisphaerales bacterium]
MNCQPFWENTRTGADGNGCEGELFFEMQQLRPHFEHAQFFFSDAGVPRFEEKTICVPTSKKLNRMAKIVFINAVRGELFFRALFGFFKFFNILGAVFFKIILAAFTAKFYFAALIVKNVRLAHAAELFAISHTSS